jgi:hypothetical protein
VRIKRFARKYRSEFDLCGEQEKKGTPDVISAMRNDPESHGVAAYEPKIATEEMRNTDVLHLAQSLEWSDFGVGLASSRGSPGHEGYAT